MLLNVSSDANFCYPCRIEAGRLAEENLLLRQNISELREEDLKEKQHELLYELSSLYIQYNCLLKDLLANTIITKCLPLG